MSAVGGDAAFMLEKALEEMDSIFRDNIVDSTSCFNRSSLPSKSLKSAYGRNSESVNKIFDELEFLLSGYVDGSTGLGIVLNIREIFEHLKTLKCTFAFLNELSLVNFYFIF